ncbi:hypothetical protein [Alkalimarinus coralli]|uniref:hypothetical protein n=1 Tax=Alkalimarinus coralli TaxID=2935863 RepID=UPI00202B1335|nr:hypothetical protein [Alkalimarinus coralli]
MVLPSPISKAKRLYVKLMMNVIGRALQAISQVDDTIKKEVNMLPDGFSFQMTVLPNGPSFSAKKTTNGELVFLSSNPEEKVDLSIGFKHLTHSFLVLSFQESTSEAFANDRMMVNGDISYALRVTRILNRVEAFILPKLLAERALKEYPHEVKLPEKLLHGARIYYQMASNLITVNKS